MTGDLIRQDNTFIGAGAPVTGDEITGNDAAYPLNTFYIDKTNGASYVRTGVGKVTGDWTQIGGGGGIESVVAGSGIDVDDTDPANPVVSATGGSSYLVYTALLTQSGENAPTAIVLQNTLSGAIVWTRDAAGLYVGTLAGVFTLNKTLVIVSNNGQFDTVFYSGSNEDTNTIFLNTAVTGNGADDLMINTPIEIRVYP